MSFDIKDKIDSSALFGNDAAEDEDSSTLERYFVHANNYSSFFSSSEKIRFVRARKGAGKSALLSMVAYQKAKSDEKPLVISLSGPSLASHTIDESSNSNEIVAAWQQYLCQMINVEIGKELGFSLSDTTLSMIDIAEMSGQRKRKFLSSLLDRINVRIFDSEIGISHSNTENHRALFSRFMAESSDREIWLVIDDVDATFQNSLAERLAISAFFSACRSLTRSVDGLIIRAAVRSDTWETIREFDESLDKIDQYLLDIHWSNSNLLEIISERIRTFLEFECGVFGAENLSTDDLIETVFPKELGWGSAARHFQLLTQISNRRPRWALQACKLAAIEANNRGTLISKKVMRHILTDFGNLRIKDLVSEYSNKVTGLREVIAYFAYRDRGYSTEELLKHCNFIVSQTDVNLSGAKINNGRVLARFLFSTGFLNGRENINGSFQQFTFEEQPFHLVNDINPYGENVNWEIQSAYQRALQLTNIAPHLI